MTISQMNPFRRQRLTGALLAAAVLGLAACETELAPPFEIQDRGTLQGQLFFDAGADGVFDPLAGDTPMANVRVVVLERGTTRAVSGGTANTDAQGRFELVNLPPGTHDVFIDPTTLPQGVVCQNPIPTSVFRQEASFLPVSVRQACLIRIQDAKALPVGEIVNVRGVVTVRPGQHRAQGDDMYIEDTSGAVKIFSTAIGGWGVQIGDRIDINGTVSLFASGGTPNEIQLTSPVLNEITRDVGAPTPRPVTTQFAATQGGVLSPDAGRLIRLTRARLTEAFAAGGGRNARFDDGSGPVEIRLDTGVFAAAAAINANFRVGACYNVTGTITPFAGAAQVKPRSMDDFQEVPCN